MQRLEKLEPLALLLLRWAVGITFICHGYPKLAHTPEWTQAFIHMGFPSYFAYIAGVVETFGGLLLILGLFTRIAGFFLAGEMLVAFLRVDLPHVSMGNSQLSMVLAAAAFTFLVIGAGTIALDHAIFRGKA